MEFINTNQAHVTTFEHILAWYCVLPSGGQLQFPHGLKTTH
jgi:hypothetical protein